MHSGDVGHGRDPHPAAFHTGETRSVALRPAQRAEPEAASPAALPGPPLSSAFSLGARGERSGAAKLGTHSCLPKARASRAAPKPLPSAGLPTGRASRETKVKLNPGRFAAQPARRPGSISCPDPADAPRICQAPSGSLVPGNRRPPGGGVRSVDMPRGRHGPEAGKRGRPGFARPGPPPRPACPSGPCVRCVCVFLRRRIAVAGACAALVSPQC